MDNKVFPGADENTPSLAQYFSWINHTNEGPTEHQTLANLAFFQWMNDEYGMKLDIYAFDAGAIDGAGFYGSMKSDRFKRRFPNGFGPIAEKAAKFGCRLGIWGGPDGFGETEEDAQERIETMVSLCRDYNFQLFKFDSVCGNLRPEKIKYFIKMMTECRKYSPDLILLNHRLQLGEGLPHATTFLWEGMEMYTDVFLPNPVPGVHNRVGEISRGLPPELKRLTEDHGVCLSSSLDYWEDSLIQQAFNRSLILAPEIYGSPWLLSDDEFPRLARIYNLHRRYRDILINGLLLPEEPYGKDAVSRGSDNTRFISLRNVSWERKTIPVKLDETIGFKKADKIQVRRIHPFETILGDYNWGDTVDVEIEPFRACLIMASSEEIDEIGIRGCEAEIIKDKPGEDAVLQLLGLPGSTATVCIETNNYSSASIDGEECPDILTEGGVNIDFEGTPITKEWHRKLADLKKADVPDDAGSLYEATCYAADNNPFEVRCLDRSGPTAVPEVQAARDAFFNQETFVRRGLWDDYLFYDDPDTFFAVSRRWGEMRINRGCFRIDFGEAIEIDKLVLHTAGDYNMQPLKNHEAVRRAYVSSDLKEWIQVKGFAEEDLIFDISVDKPVRYFKMQPTPDRVNRVTAAFKGKEIDCKGWRASNLFAPEFNAEHAWSATFQIDEIQDTSYLAIPVFGPHVPEAVYAAAKCEGKYIGSPRRASAFRANSWECRANGGKNYTYFIPLDKSLEGKTIEVYLLGLETCAHKEIKSEAWITAYPIPYSSKTVVLRNSH